ncbi:ATP-binding cassette domain-containing protein [Actinacidiphila sp. bgisy167]|uniref:ATP-binding cassette domain-containing protein n=1 Tax=Actinacidiphila sp. bgisy167 TaxID=3413797 RepID=UPI003D75D557
MLEVRELIVSYGMVRALDAVSISVDRGGITAVLGANGAGKTTLLRVVGGLVRPRSGSVLLDGADITGLPAEEVVRLGLAHVPEGRGVITELTVHDNLRMASCGARSSRFPVPADRGGQIGRAGLVGVQAGHGVDALALAGGRAAAVDADGQAGVGRT